MDMLQRWLLTAVWCLVALPAIAGELVVDVLDVGQGDAVLIRTSEKTVLIDAGTAKSAVPRQLRQLGVNRLDLVVATHPHADHIGGMANVVDAFEIGLYLDSGQTHTTMTYANTMEAVERRAVPYRTAQQGMTLRLGDEATFTVLHPGPTLIRNTRSDLNSNSVVLELVHGDTRWLFTGDAEDPTERALMGRDVGDIDVLKVAHHGSGHSSSRSFLARVQPDVALISCGVKNRYGHPDPETVDRLEQAGATIYRTDRSEHIRLWSDGQQIETFEGPLSEIVALTVQPFAPTDTGE